MIQDNNEVPIKAVIGMVLIALGNGVEPSILEMPYPCNQRRKPNK